MITYLLAIPGFYTYLLLCWALYLGVMLLSQKRKESTWWVRFFGYQVFALGLVLDVSLNVFASLLIFADRPHGWLLTDTLKFQKARGGKRGAIAEWICKELLNAFDPKGTHC